MLEIYEVKQSGARKVFKKVCTHQVDEKNGYLATHLDVSEHRVKSGHLLVVLAAKGSKMIGEDDNDNVIIILEIDYRNDFKVTENLDCNGARRRSPLPLITKILYRDCGLIMACFSGYIELFDGLDF